MDAISTNVSKVRELVNNGEFSVWVADNPVLWFVTENPPNTEVTEVGADKSHGEGGSNSCNLYAGISELVYMYQNVPLFVGKKYRFSVDIKILKVGSLRVIENSGFTQWPSVNYFSIGIKTFDFVALSNSVTPLLKNEFPIAHDITFDNVSILPIKNKVWIYK